jgi:hypothetical protein
VVFLDQDFPLSDPAAVLNDAGLDRPGTRDRNFDDENRLSISLNRHGLEARHETAARDMRHEA